MPSPPSPDGTRRRSRRQAPSSRPDGAASAPVDNVLTFERDAELEAGTDAHYEDPRYYRATYADRSEDVDYYVALAADRGGPVLEYGCGTGRIALPMARIGIDVTGVDRSAPMLAALRAALRDEPTLGGRVTVRRGDMRSVRLKRRFPLVLCTFNTFLHLYTRQDVEQFCRRVREHLAPNGRFVVDLTVPAVDELARDPRKVYRVPRFRHPSTGEVVRYGERFSYDPLRQVLIVGMEFEPRDTPERAWMTPLAHRQFFPCEVEALLHYNGLEVVDVHGDFTFEPPEPDVTDLVIHCRARRGFRG